MFILIRIGKDRKDRDKIGFFVLFIESTWGMTEKKEALYFHCGSYEKFFTLIKSDNLFIFQNNVSYEQEFLYKTANVLSFPAASQVYLLSSSIYTMQQLKILSSIDVYPTVSHCHSISTMQKCKFLISIVLHKLHHAATQHPGHGTKFVTLPSSV